MKKLLFNEHVQVILFGLLAGVGLSIGLYIGSVRF